MSNLSYHVNHDLTNEMWNRIKEFLPAKKSVGRKPLDARKTFDAILWIARTGSQWRALPSEYGRWNSVYKKFRQWIQDGVFERMLKSFWANSKNYYIFAIDSTFCKVHQDATGARKIYGNQDIGLSRGGKTTKIHAVVNEKLQPIHFILSPGNVNDNQVAIALLKMIDIHDSDILGDKAYSVTEIREYIENNFARACIPDKSNSTVKHDFDKELYKMRNIVERFFQRIKNFRRVATRYDKLSKCFCSFVTLVSFMTCIS